MQSIFVTLHTQNAAKIQYYRAFLTLIPMPDTTYRQVLAYDTHKK
ncbi:hypothetical protein PI172_0103 [Prevotella intermedia]|uniref:Uncharacterized protein n=1 Tax=Prevotella intermedia TaxID=28131 RepID=A0AAD1BGQ2_PREIN|nr:hypothetical protein PI172_0103 [Prevotella intermedia]